jgi:hypothetical protein
MVSRIALTREGLSSLPMFSHRPKFDKQPVLSSLTRMPPGRAITHLDPQAPHAYSRGLSGGYVQLLCLLIVIKRASE